MNPSVEARLAKVRKVSRIGNGLCIAAMVLTCLIGCILIVAGLAFPDGATCDFGAGDFPCSDLSVAARALAGTAAVVGIALVLKGLYHLSRLFKNYSQGQIFTRESVAQIRKIGMTVFVYGAFQIALLIGTVILMGAQQISWPDDVPIPLPFAAFINGGLILLISWVMEVGTELREETELTV
jgi:hypothetical protein